jgi:acetyltransferase-like isoleucine patch superfamily enzyme
VNVVVLDVAIIRKGCVIGAASLVKGKLEEYGVF